MRDCLPLFWCLCVVYLSFFQWSFIHLFIDSFSSQSVCVCVCVCVFVCVCVCVCLSVCLSPSHSPLSLSLPPSSLSLSLSLSLFVCDSFSVDPCVFVCSTASFCLGTEPLRLWNLSLETNVSHCHGAPHKASACDVVRSVAGASIQKHFLCTR